VCGTKNFSSVRLYSAPQSHWTIVVILRICAYGRPVQAGFVRHNRSLALFRERSQALSGGLLLSKLIGVPEAPGMVSHSGVPLDKR
jgi:hypothetical protein